MNFESSRRFVTKYLYLTHALIVNSQFFFLKRLKMMRFPKFIVSLTLLGVLASVLVEVHSNEEKKDIGTVIGIDLGTTYSW